MPGGLVLRSGAGDCLALAYKVDIWFRWGRHFVAEEEAWVRGFVVNDVLPGDPQAILWIVEEGCEPQCGRNRGGVKPERFAVRGDE